MRTFAAAPIITKTVMALHQFDYIFAFGLIFAFLDAWNIGANDVANSFATSVSSRSLTLRQAMMIATVCEFAGSVLVGLVAFFLV
jgi:sodium-dependent phosphate transporter